MKYINKIIKIKKKSLNFTGITTKSVSGKGKLSFTINGADYFENYDVNVKPYLEISSLSHQCGPIHSHNNINLRLSRIASLKNFYLSVGGRCLNFPPLTKQNFKIKFKIFFFKILLIF